MADAAPLVVVMGVTGTGKTSVGRRLAGALGVPFADADDHHSAEAVARMGAGLALTEQDRGPWLDELNQLLRRWATAGSGGVLACSALTRHARSELAEGLPDLRFVFLTGDPALIRERLDRRTGHYAGADLLPSQLATLEPPDDAVRVSIEGSVDEVVDRALAGLRIRPPVAAVPGRAAGPGTDRFTDRRQAGSILAESLVDLQGEDVAVLGLLRGGVPVAAEVAAALGVPVGAIAVRKIGAPGRPELALGAATANGVIVLDDAAAAAFGLSDRELEERARRARDEALAIQHRYLPHGPVVAPFGRSVVLVDDGLATGASMRAAVAAARLDGATAVVVAVPVGAPDACRALAADADRVVCARTPERFRAVSNWFVDFTQVEEEEVLAVLRPGTVPLPPDPPQ